MSTQTVSDTPVIEWDDGVVFVFSWSSKKYYGGLIHLQVAQANATGTQTQVTNILQTLSQTQFQVSSDPQSWMDTIKSASRSSGNKVVITFDDSTSVHYTTQVGTSYDLQVLYSLAG